MYDQQEPAVWVWARSGGVWTLRGPKLAGSDSTGLSGLSQGKSVAISADGSTIIIGSPYNNGNTGAAWIFTGTPGEAPVLPPRQRAVAH
jgi:hypothetical protein